MIIKTILVVYLVAANLVSFVQFWLDKRIAQKGTSRSYKGRIQEKTLFLVAISGGALGAWIGMYTLRHKTRKWYFVLFIPFILLAQIAGVYYFFTTFV